MLVIEIREPGGPDVLVPAVDVVAEVQALRCNERRKQLSLFRLSGPLGEHVFLPAPVIVFGRICEGHA